MNNQTIILLTKQFPFGHQETYLFNELPYLVKEFTRVVIIPYDEFSYKPNENRINGISGVEIFSVNSSVNKLTVYQKIKREYVVWRILLFEIIKGREALNHLKYSKRNFSQLRHSYSCAKSLNEYIKSNNLKDIIFYNYWLHGGVIISSIFKRFIGKENYPIVSRAHAYDVYHKDWYTIYPKSKYLFLGFETWKVYNADLILPISTHAYNHFSKLFPHLKSKFKIARLGVNTQFHLSGIKHNDESVPYVFVSCSNIDDNKRIYRIPQIISLVNKPVKWIHFGKGTDTDMKKVTGEIEKYKLTDNCFLPGLRPNSEILNYYKNNRVDLIINLSQIEGIPVALMEAASFGIPMVATNAVGNAEIVNNENGFLIGVDFDSKELANQLNNYFDNTEEIKSKKEAARATFFEHYNASKNYPDFIKVIKDFSNEY